MHSDQHLKINEVKFKLDELKIKYNIGIIPLLIYYNNEYIMGFVREPNRSQKSLALSKRYKSKYWAGMEILDICLIREHSDERLYSMDSKYDDLVLTAAFKIVDEIEYLSNNSGKILEKYKSMINNSGDEQIAAMIQYEFKINPDELTDEVFYKYWSRIDWLMKKNITNAKFK